MSASDRPALIDTNIVLRYIMRDPEEMAKRAAEIIDSSATLLLSELVLVETAYVLASIYGIRRPAIVDVLIDFVQKQNIHPAGLPKPLVLEALGLCRDSKRYSFTDAFLWAQARDLGARLYSFDERLPQGGVEIVGME